MRTDTLFLKVAKSSEEWLSYIDSFREPLGDLERSWNQFKCTRSFEDSLHRLKRNVQSAVLIPISFVSTMVSKLFLKKDESDKVDCLILPAGAKYTNYPSLDSILPKDITNRYKNIKVFEREKRRSLIFTGVISYEIIKILIKIIIRYPLKFLFIYRIFIQLCTVNRYIEIFHPEAIVTVGGENDFTSSVLTGFCESMNIKYICIMHGEYFLSPYHAFVRFSEFYVWEKIYIDQFVRTRSPQDMFKLYTPDRYNMKIERDRLTYYVGYYLQEFNGKQLEAIRDNLLKIVDMGYKCKVRPHKRATDMKTFLSVFKGLRGIDIESTDIPIEKSLGNCKYIVSIYSTVISEAYYNNLPVLIDDLSDPELYETLKNVMYGNLYRNIGRLTDLVNGRD